MKSAIVADGPYKLAGNSEFQVRLHELNDAIYQRHAVELGKSGFIRRFFIRRKIAAEFRRERRKIEPSPQSVFYQLPRC